jgi:ubiquinone/menaquinone biosynthesis C-methylase UbiE
MPQTATTENTSTSRAKATSRSPDSEAVTAQFDTQSAALDYADSHHDRGASARFFRSRISLVTHILASLPGGDLLDVGSGPGMMIKELTDTRRDDFRITAIDLSPAMAKLAAEASDGEYSRAVVGSVETLPFPDASFDVILALGVLEYTDVNAALAEISRVTRPGGLVLASMLNPASPYRFFEWHIFWPLLRALRSMKNWPNGRSSQRRTSKTNGIVAYSEHTFREKLTTAVLHPVDVAYFDINFLLPPIDRFVRPFTRGWERRPERTISRRWRKWLGTSYLVVACKARIPVAAGRSLPRATPESLNVSARRRQVVA